MKKEQTFVGGFCLLVLFAAALYASGFTGAYIAGAEQQPMGYFLPVMATVAACAFTVAALEMCGMIVVKGPWYGLPCTVCLFGPLPFFGWGGYVDHLDNPQHFLAVHASAGLCMFLIGSIARKLLKRRPTG